MYCCVQPSVQMTHASSVNILVAHQMMEKFCLTAVSLQDKICLSAVVSIVCMAVSIQNNFQGTHFSTIIKEDSIIYMEPSLGFYPSSLNSGTHRYVVLLCQFLTAVIS